MIVRRSIGTCILLTVVTCGIYGIFWFYQVLTDLYYANNMPNNAGVDILLTIVTCGIYGIYIYYKMGTMVNSARIMLGMTPKDDSVMFLILSIFGLGFVVFIIVQDELNNTIGPAIAASQAQYVAQNQNPPNMM